MGQSCELMAKTWQIPRDEQDQLALESHRKAAAAYDEGFFDDLVVEFRGLKTRQQRPRATRTLEKLAAAQAVVRSRSGDADGGQFHADDRRRGGGAAGERRMGEGARLTGARVSDLRQVARPSTSSSKEGLLMAPAYAVPRMLADAGLTLQDFDFYEIHEAFEAQVLCTLKAWQSPEFCRERLGLDRAARHDRSRQAQRERRQRGDRSSVRRDRRAHPRDAGEAAREARQRTRPDLDLHGRRHGRDGDCRAVENLTCGRQHQGRSVCGPDTADRRPGGCRVGVPCSLPPFEADAIPGRGQ